MSNELTVSAPVAPASGSSSVSSVSVPGVSEAASLVSYGDVAARKAEIEQIMRTDFHRYETEYAAEYLQILKEERGETRATDIMSVDDSRNMMMRDQAGRDLVRSWDSYGGFKHHLGNVQRDVIGLVQSMGNDREQLAFMARFDRSLSPPIQYAIYDAIAAGAPTFVTPASADDMTVFSELPAGKDLVAEWGNDAPTKIATIWKRCDAMLDRLSEQEQHAALVWFGKLSDAQMKSICKLLAGDKR